LDVRLPARLGLFFHLSMLRYFRRNDLKEYPGEEVKGDKGWSWNVAVAQSTNPEMESEECVPLYPRPPEVPRSGLYIELSHSKVDLQVSRMQTRPLLSRKGRVQ